MSVTKITVYRVEVRFDDRAWTLYKDSNELDVDVLRACKNSIVSGTNFYSSVIMWADYNYREEAQQCEAALMQVNYKWRAKARDYDNNLED